MTNYNDTSAQIVLEISERIIQSIAILQRPECQHLLTNSPNGITLDKSAYQAAYDFYIDILPFLDPIQITGEKQTSAFPSMIAFIPKDQTEEIEVLDFTKISGYYFDQLLQISPQINTDLFAQTLYLDMSIATVFIQFYTEFINTWAQHIEVPKEHFNGSISPSYLGEIALAFLNFYADWAPWQERCSFGQVDAYALYRTEDFEEGKFPDLHDQIISDLRESTPAEGYEYLKNIHSEPNLICLPLTQKTNFFQEIHPAPMFKEHLAARPVENLI